MKINYMKNVIDRILREEIKARNDDAYLIFRVWQEMQEDRDRIIPEYVYQLLRSYYPDSITRIRRMFQKEGLYPADIEVQKHRRKNEITMAYRLAAPDKDYPEWQTENGKVLVTNMHYDHLKNAIQYILDKGHATESERLINSAWLLILETEMERRTKLF